MTSRHRLIGRRLGSLLTARGAIMVVVLTGVWCALWQDVSVANLLSGVLIAIGVLATGVGTPNRGSVRLVPMVKLIWVVLIDLVTSTVDVAAEILTPADRTDEAIVAVHIPREGRHHFLLLIIAITVTPGTAVVDADPDTGTLYLHLLHAERRDAVTKHVSQLTRLACDALPVPAVSRREDVTS